MTRSRWFWGSVLAIATVTAMAGCTASKPHPKSTPSTTSSSGGPVSSTALAAPHPCTITGFTCGSLIVPVDHAHPSGDTLSLSVAVSQNANAPRGVLLLLTGGPGQPGVGLLETVSTRVAYLADDYQLVMIDQRGTAGTAFHCPELQAQVGSSDIAAASPAAVSACADEIGPARDFYTTADTVADLEDLRNALHASQWTLDGVSYGSFVAERYAFAHPDRVTRMVLDSVVPPDGVPALYEASLHRTAEVLRTACTTQHCGYDPAADVATVVRTQHDGVGLFDLIVTATIVDPTFAGGQAFYPVLDLIHKAAHGDAKPLADAINDLETNSDQGAAAYSSGLHVATICADLVGAPWGPSTAPLARAAAITAAEKKITSTAVWPFDAATAIGQGLIGSCRYWPPDRPDPAPTGKITVPALLINGDRDLSTPLPWAQASLTRFTNGKLVVITGMGHSIQGRNPQGDAAVKAFLLA